MTPPTKYRSLNGRVTPVTEMHDAHLDHAIAKHTREGRDPVALGMLKAEKARRMATQGA